MYHGCVVAVFGQKASWNSPLCSYIPAIPCYVFPSPVVWSLGEIWNARPLELVLLSFLATRQALKLNSQDVRYTGIKHVSVSFSIQYPFISILWVVYFCSILHLFAHTYLSFTFFSYVACFLLLRFGECFTVFHILICACPLGFRGDFGDGRCVKSQTYWIRKSPVYSAQLIAWPNLAEATSHQQFQDISTLVTDL